MVGSPVCTLLVLTPHMPACDKVTGGLHVALCNMGLKVRREWTVYVRGAMVLLYVT